MDYEEIGARVGEARIWWALTRERLAESKRRTILKVALAAKDALREEMPVA